MVDVRPVSVAEGDGEERYFFFELDNRGFSATVLDLFDTY